MTIKKMDSGVNYIQMETYILATFHKIRNMGKVHSIGLACVRLPAQNRPV